MSDMVVMERTAASGIFRLIIRSVRKEMPHAYAPAPPVNARTTEANNSRNIEPFAKSFTEVEKIIYIN